MKIQASATRTATSARSAGSDAPRVLSTRFRSVRAFSPVDGVAIKSRHSLRRYSPHWSARVAPQEVRQERPAGWRPVSYTHLRAHETGRNLVCRLLLEKKKREHEKTTNILCRIK